MMRNYIKWVEENREMLIEISDKIWEYAETGFNEFKSSKLLAETLSSEGFSVKEGVADIPTAFTATYGDGTPVIGILGEYDALPGLSQAAEPVRKPIKQDAPGHGCGHNLLGTGSLGGALAVKEAIDAGDAKGTVRYYGCPAEELYNAKGAMINAGLFEDVDITLTWHPFFLNLLNTMSAMAMNSVIFKYHGITAHAAGDPQNGRSALDAVELMNVGANYMREHIIPDARLHYVITNGGKAPNVVPDFSEVWYYVRAPERPSVESIYKRVLKIAEGASLMTETELEVEFISGSYNHIHNEVIGDVLLKNMREVGPPKFRKKDREYAKELLKTIPSNSMEGYTRFIPPEFKEMAMTILSQPLNNIVLPIIGRGKTLPGSTDVADVSWVTPLGEFQIACEVMGSPGHSWQNVCTAGMSIGHKGMLTAAKVLAISSIELMNNLDLVKKAKKELESKTKENPYNTPFPKDHQHPIERYTKTKKS
ncbi:MAG: amidohydrolase [Candidatus Lokiarchaeota archaeon]|nr:amidohydrolase [Candidatus Lokiarchaeota archaeon]MBD3338704.1 amidohydrolase [Candidatus Lokiarchaeota archaeon]